MDRLHSGTKDRERKKKERWGEGEQGMNSKEGIDIKGNQRRAQRIESNRKRTKEEIREAGE